MRKLRIFEHVSLDGVIQHSSERTEDGDFPYGDWTTPTPTGVFVNTYRHVGAFRTAP